jgi:hypothetical protein
VSADPDQPAVQIRAGGFPAGTQAHFQQAHRLGGAAEAGQHMGDSVQPVLEAWPAPASRPASRSSSHCLWPGNRPAPVTSSAYNTPLEREAVPLGSGIGGASARLEVGGTSVFVNAR